MIRYA